MRKILKSLKSNSTSSTKKEENKDSLSGAAKILDRVCKGLIYLLIFLAPVFFLPWTTNVLNFNKQTLLVGLGLLAFFSWMIKILIVGKINLNISKFHIPVVLFFFVSLFSTIFSLWRYGSFWGWPQSVSDSLLTLLFLVLLYFLVVNLFKKKEIFTLIKAFLVSSFLVILFGIFQLLGRFILPFDFTRSVSFNTVGSINQLGLFAAVLLPLLIFFVIGSKRFWRILSGVMLALIALLLLLINFHIAWWVVVAGAALAIAAVTQRRDVVDNRWLVLPMFFLALALFFGFFRFQIPGVPARPLEVYLKQGTSLDVAWKSLKARPILGSGPGTFIYNFSKYKDISINSSFGWNLRFDNASSKALNVLATTGVLGILSFLGLIGMFFFLGVKGFFMKSSEKTKAEKNQWLLGAGLFITFVALSFSYFFYSSVLVLDLLFFLVIASFVVLASSERKEIELKPSSLLTLGVTFAVTLVFIFGLGLLILEGQRYLAEVRYFQGVKEWQEGQFDQGLVNMGKAVSINPGSDLYWRNLSQFYLQRINIEIQKGSSDSTENINPISVANWSVRGFIYQNLVGIVKGTADWAIGAYDEASNLEPVNPYYPTQKGIILLSKALSLSGEKKTEKEELFATAKTQFDKAANLKSDYAPVRYQTARLYQIQGKLEEAINELEEAQKLAPFDVGLAFQLGLIYYQSKDYDKAGTELERAVVLDPNYANALYFLGLVYDKQGKKQKAIEKFEKIAVLNSDNKEVKSILENLKAGKGALEGIVEKEPPQAPIKEEPEEISPEEETPAEEPSVEE